MMKSLIVTIFSLLTCATTVAQVSFDVTVAEKKRIVSGAVSYSQTDDVAFANALLWAVNEGPARKEEITECDFVKRQLTMVYNLKRDDEPAYTCRLSIRIAQGQLMFLVNDIKMQGGLKSAFLNFDKLNPEKKPKHQDIINDFQGLNNKKLEELISFVNDHKPGITNWKNVCQGKIERGMTTDEVRMVYGKPISTQENGTESQYVFSTFVYVFFDNGVVKSFVN